MHRRSTDPVDDFDIDPDPTTMEAARSLGYWPMRTPLPVLLTDAQFALVLGISPAHFFNLKKLGRFKVFETQVATTTRTRYCGRLVLAFVRGEWSHARTFGAKRRR